MNIYQPQNTQMPQKIKALIIIFTLTSIFSFLLFLCGCSTPMMKASPFYTGEIVCGVSSTGKMVKWNDPESAGVKKLLATQMPKHFDDDRINIWPMFYKNFLLYSIIWPIGEINDVGWEIRPLVSIDNYNESYKAMAYMWGYNGKEGSSYLFPAYYFDKDSVISLLGGWGDNYLYVIPPLFFKNKNSKGEDILIVLFPMSRFNLTTGDSYVFPLYARNEDSFFSLLLGWNKKGLYILPPLFINTTEHVHGKPEITGNQYYFLWPFSGYNTTTNKSYVFPIYIKDEDSLYSLLFGYNENCLFILPPCFIMKKEIVGNSYNILWPFFHMQPAKNKYYSFPMFYYSDDEASGDFCFSYLLPFGWVYDNGHHSGSLFIPLYINETRKSDGKNSFFTFLFGWNNSGEDYYVTPFFVRSKYFDRTDYHIMFPFAQLRLMKNPEAEISPVQGHVFPFYSYYQDKHGYDLDIMFPFVASSCRGPEQDKIEYHRYLPFYYDYKDSKYSHTNYSLFGTTENKINGTDYGAWYLLPLYFSNWETIVNYELKKPQEPVNTEKGQMPWEKKYNRLETARSNTFIMPDILISENKDKGEYDFSLLPFYFYNKNKRTISHSTLLWLFTQSEDLEKKTVDAQAFWYLYYYTHQEKTETEKERTNARLLWKLYHRERYGDEVNFDIFPFISYSENEKRSKFSFCWRLFSYENSKESFKLHLFFLPVMW